MNSEIEVQGVLICFHIGIEINKTGKQVNSSGIISCNPDMNIETCISVDL